MDSISKDPNGYSPGDIIARLKRCIDSGIEGIDYTFKQRDKNEELFRKYNITTKKRREILYSLTEDDYVRWDYSNNASFNEVVYFFEKTVQLIPRFIEDAKEVRVELYIKLTWNDETNGVLVVISFHEKEY